MHIKLDASVINQAELLRQLHGLTGERAARAYAKALNDTGFEIRRAMQDEMRAVFDKPTDYILRSPRVRMAKPDKLSVTIEPAYMGGKGIDPQKILDAQAWGGRRRDKRSEVALRRAGILPVGYQTAIPDEQYGGPYPGSDDGRGNLKGSFLVQIISYFQAFGEQGYKANMSDKGYKRIHKNGRKSAVAMGEKKWTRDVRGRRYLVSYGAMRGSARMTAKGESDMRAQHLGPGIWAVSGTGGADVRPVLVFVKQGNYTPRLDMDKVAKRADAENYLGKRIRYRIREAAGV
ncbi:hypothetical protein [Comamonas jiangduensis]|uniref:Phage protein n=1 Tax=Comamonas jiangduensis TaxID=1194168 RepID=A0ABV4IEN0_9BURK